MPKFKPDFQQQKILLLIAYCNSKTNNNFETNLDNNIPEMQSCKKLFMAQKEQNCKIPSHFAHKTMYVENRKKCITVTKSFTSPSPKTTCNDYII